MFASTTSNVEKIVLDNGLTVLIEDKRAAPVIAVLAHVRAGCFHEPDRWNGISHVVEHMFFKGTRRRPAREQIAEEVRALGGTINAATYYEETSYYIVAPGAHLERALEIQADTFAGSLFDAEELEKEIEVIIQESKQKRDNPGALLIETLYARAYDRHPIRRWRIGPDETLRALRREDLLAFVEQTYRPENIILAVVGDVEPAKARDLVERHWSQMPRGILMKEPSPEEPERTEFRYARMRGDIRQRLFAFGFHAPALLHRDAPALMILGALLSDGRSARLHRALKEQRRLVNSVWAGYEGFMDMGVVTMGAETVGDDPLAAERALFEEAARVREDSVREEELQRVKTRIQSRRLYMQEEVLGVARNLVGYEALGDYRLSDEMLARLQSVTPEDLQRVTAQYLPPQRATLVEYLPESVAVAERDAETVFAAIAGKRNEEAGKPGISGFTPGFRASSEDERASIQEIMLPTGATLLFRARRDLPLVSFHALFPGGKSAENRLNAGLTSLMLKSALKGTESYTAEEIAQTTEGLGSNIGLTLAPDYFGFAMKLLADRVQDGLPVLKEVIARPVFPEEEVEKEKQSIYGEVRRQRDSMFANAMDLFNRACFGDQPYGMPASGIEEAVASLTPEDLRAWHARWVRGGSAIFAVVGDIEPGALADLLADAVPTGTAGETDRRRMEYLPPGEQIERIARKQTAAVMGFPGATVAEADRHALDVLAEITSGLAGRFFQAVRGDNALAYAVSGFHRPRRDAGNFITYTATSPENEMIAREILLQECERLTSEPVGEKELAGAKEAIRGEHMISTQTFSAQAAEMAVLRLYGLPADAPERYLARVQAVTPEELQEVAARYLRPERAWLGVARGGEGGEETGQSVG